MTPGSKTIFLSADRQDCSFTAFASGTENGRIGAPGVVFVLGLSFAIRGCGIDVAPSPAGPSRIRRPIPRGQPACASQVALNAFDRSLDLYPELAAAHNDRGITHHHYPGSVTSLHTAPERAFSRFAVDEPKRIDNQGGCGSSPTSAGTARANPYHPWYHLLMALPGLIWP